jgi:predicted CopG family antitoxin
MFIVIMATTISISVELRDKLKNLGRAGDSYEDVIRRMYEVTSKSLLMAYLYDKSDSVSIDEAIAEARKKWQKSS